MQGKQILVIDNDPHVLRMVKLILSNEGAQIHTAANGMEGLTQFYAHRSDLVILDVMMNSLLEGLNATWTIRADQELQSIPVLMVSSIASSEYAESFPTDEYVPVDNFLCKPIAPQKLLKEVKRLLDQRKQRRVK